MAVIEFKCKCGNSIRANLEAKQLETIDKEYRKCPKCNMMLKVPPPPPENLKICPNCKLPNFKESERCERCEAIFARGGPSTKRVTPATKKADIDYRLSEENSYEKALKPPPSQEIDPYKNALIEVQNRLRDLENAMGTINFSKLSIEIAENAKKVAAIDHLESQFRGLKERFDQIPEKVKEGIQKKLEEAESQNKIFFEETYKKEDRKVASVLEEVADLKEQNQMSEKIFEKIDTRLQKLEDFQRTLPGDSKQNLERFQDKLKVLESRQEDTLKNRDELLKKIFFLEGSVEEKMRSIHTLENKWEEKINILKNASLSEDARKQIEDRLLQFLRPFVQELLNKLHQNHKQEVLDKIQQLESRISKGETQKNINPEVLQENLRLVFQDFQQFFKKQEQLFLTPKDFLK
ncbi:MAG: hypothetical protein AABZ60_24100 [Planctomycetota bacterium]